MNVIPNESDSLKMPEKPIHCTKMYGHLSDQQIYKLQRENRLTSMYIAKDVIIHNVKVHYRPPTASRIDYYSPIVP